METILQKLQTEYPTLSPELLQEFSLLLSLGAGEDEKKQKELVSAAKKLIDIYMFKESDIENLNAQMQEQSAQKIDINAFREAVLVELKDKEVPEAFTKNIVIVDPTSTNASSAAAAIVTSYKACVQQMNNQQMNSSARPVMASQNSSGIPSDIERFINSRRSGGPAAGKFRVEEK